MNGYICSTTIPQSILIMKKKNIFFVLLICLISSSCNKEEQTDELQDKDFYSDVTTRASYISGTITGLDKVRFHAPVRPGDTVKTKCNIKRVKGPFYFAEGTASVNEKVCVAAEFSFAIKGA